MKAEGRGEADDAVPGGREGALLRRTRCFAVRIVRLSAALPRTREADVLGNQLLRSGTSVAANYRSARRGRSPAEFRAKLGVALEESDESVFWLDLMIETAIVPPDRLRPLHAEAEQITAMLAAALLTARRNDRPHPKHRPK